MSERQAQLRHIVVAGDGIVGWSAAAALKRQLPAVNVTLLAVPPSPDALAERVIGTLPSINGFHADLGLGDDDAVGRTGSSFRLGTLFSGWAGKRRAYVHAYGPHGRTLPAASFHLHWVRAERERTGAPFDAFSAGAALARLGRFDFPVTDGADPFAAYGFGLNLDLAGYKAMMRAFALHLGVVEDRRGLAGVERDDRGWIDALALDDGTRLRGDLFVDATGPAASLRGMLDQRRDDWRQWSPVDRVLFGEAARSEPLSPLDEVTAWTGGWRWRATTPRSVSAGIAYASSHADDATAEAELRKAGATAIGAPVAIAAGHRPEPWSGNCIAIGEAATVVEPLEWTNLHLAHSAIDRLVAMLPNRDCAPIEAADFNRQATAEAERVRDFILLHYAASNRAEPFWRQCADIDLPPSLAHTLALFRERGRLPFYEEETFARDSWLAVLFGQGVMPRRSDPLVETVSAADARRMIDQWRAAIAAGAPSRPTLAAFFGDRQRYSA